MTIDSDWQLKAVARSVSFAERDGHSAGVVTLSRGFSTTAEELWDAVTSAERIQRWFLPVSGDLRRGGRFQLEGNAGGEISECEQRSHFALTWEFAGDVSWVEVSISEDGGGHSRLTLSHTALLSPHWDEYGPGATGVGWEMGLMGLAIHLEHPNAPMPDENTFAISPDGKAFIAGSSEAWGEAAIDAGTDAEAARAAAGRTTAFYTGESVEPD